MNSKGSNTYAVYCHYFPNGKVYVGLTCNGDNIEEKRFGHNGSKYKRQTLVYRAIEKYGWENIEHIIIARNINKESAINIEKDLIALYRSSEREYGYNISPGGEEGSYHSEESRKKMSEQRKGKKKSEEHKRKIGEAHRGMKMSDDFCKKMSEIAKNRHHDTTKDPRNMAVLQYRISDGQLVNRYLSIAEAARQTGASKSHISECAKDKRRQELGCVWLYESMATEEYIKWRIDKVKLHNLYVPIAISKSSDFTRALYCENKTMAAKYIHCGHDKLNAIIDNHECYKGYYAKIITADEYILVAE